MRLKNILLVVEDMEKSITFYKKLFGLDVTLKQEGNVMLAQGLVLQDKAIWEEAMGRKAFTPNHASLIYFIEYDLEAFVAKVKAYSEPITIVTPLTEDVWGKKIVRLYDPDGHLIEVGTP